jgi:23S rRNA (guanosine2251-2'-O)-methyltransferase
VAKSAKPAVSKGTPKPGDKAIHRHFSDDIVPSQKGLPWLWGVHPVHAALQNKNRVCHQLCGTKEALESCAPFLAQRPKLAVKTVSRDALAALLSPHALHQGLALQVSPLPTLFLDDFLARRPEVRRLVVLDQVTDPHNLGAIIRSACAFGMQAVVLTPRHSPPLEGVVAKSASGALEHLPILMTPNLAQGLRLLKEKGFWCAGLAEEGRGKMAELAALPHLALVMGSEGAGLRALTEKLCDLLVSLPTAPHFPTLNVSAAAAVAFYGVQNS